MRLFLSALTNFSDSGHKFYTIHPVMFLFDDQPKSRTIPNLLAYTLPLLMGESREVMYGAQSYRDIRRAVAQAA